MKSGIPEVEKVPFPLVTIVVLLFLQIRCSVVKERRTRDLLDSCLLPTIYQRNADRNRKLWNIVSTERSIHHNMHVYFIACSQWEYWNHLFRCKVARCRLRYEEDIDVTVKKDWSQLCSVHEEITSIRLFRINRTNNFDQSL